MALQSRRSSGDPQADRRYGFALDLAERGDLEAAIDLMRQALELVPDFAPALDRLADFQERAGDRTGAEESLRALLRLDAGDAFAASLRLARLGVMEEPETPPHAYVAALFDAFARKFETTLVERLQYRAPFDLGRLIKESGRLAPLARALDLGCGTGLMGEVLRKDIMVLEGVDLARDMIKLCEDKKLYDRLEAASLEEAMLQREEASFEIITAADVFCYLGALETVLAQAARLLVANGLLAFSVEAGSQDASWSLKDSLRYGHGRIYLETLLAGCGFDVLAFEETDLRMDRGQAIRGFLVLARRKSAQEVESGPLPLLAASARSARGTGHA